MCSVWAVPQCTTFSVPKNKNQNDPLFLVFLVVSVLFFFARATPPVVLEKSSLRFLDGWEGSWEHFGASLGGFEGTTTPCYNQAHIRGQSGSGVKVAAPRNKFEISRVLTLNLDFLGLRNFDRFFQIRRVQL